MCEIRFNSFQSKMLLFNTNEPRAGNLDNP